MPKPTQSTPKGVRPYRFHGVDVEYADGDTHAVGTCPSCGRDKKFSVDVVEGIWRCFACTFGNKEGGGNVYTFLRWLADESDKKTNGQTKILAKDRGLLYPETLTYWGAAVSVTTGDWIIPGYTPDGKIGNLYKYTRDRSAGRMVLFGTPDVGSQMFGLGLWDDSRPNVYLCESVWDAMVLWELLRSVKDVDGRLEHTGNPDASLLSRSNVVAIPGCGAVGEPLRKYGRLLAGKRVVLAFHSDHPKDRDGTILPPAGWDGARRAAGILAGGNPGSRPDELAVLRWGPEGYDPDRKSGWDVRDVLTADPDVRGRAGALASLLEGVEPVPDEWVPGRSPESVRTGGTAISTVKCSRWDDLENAWRRGMNWRTSMGDVLSTMLAVAASTSQQGTSQLFLMVIGDAGSGKTRLCDAMLTSNHCFALEHLTGFHSGWKGGGEEDFSLLARINHKTLITPEGDVMMSSPHFSQIMSQQRRIFDGTSGASYKNRKEDLRYTNLRTPWIIAGTPALMDSDQSRLGDRFLKVFVDPPGDDGKAAILRHVGYASLRGLMKAADGSADGGIVEGSMLEAYRVTGGFVDYLRENATALYNLVDGHPDDVIDSCSKLAELTSILRARPNEDDKKKEANDTKELPTRLTEQFVRMAYSLAICLGRPVTDPEVVRRVSKVATNTAHGVTQLICREVAGSGQEGLTSSVVSARLAQDPTRTSALLRFLERIRAVTHYDHKPTPRHVRTERRYRLVPRVANLFREVYGA